VKVPRSVVEVVKSQWGWTARLVSNGKEIAHSSDKALLTSYLADCGL
jgi:hypothetical protein